MLQDAIARYHELLTDEVAAESQAQLDDLLHRHGIFFGDRPLCTVLRPRFLTPSQYRYIQDRSRVLLAALHKAHDAAMADAGFRAQFGLTDWEEELIQHEPGYPEPSPNSRLDTFFDPETGELRITEYNGESPAAAAYNDILTDVFYRLRIMGAFQRDYEVRPLPARPGVLHVLLDAHRQWSGRREAPRIAILDWREVPTYSEFVLFRDYFTGQGLPCVIADPREVEYRGGRLLAGDFPITLIYKRVLISELIGREGLNHPVVRAVRDGAVCMVNPFRCKVLHKKASLAVLSDEGNAGLFTAEERAAIDEHVPWTRRVSERHTVYRGDRVDLIPFALEHREQFVLKANDEYGGKGIVLGWQTDAAGWEEALRTALSEPFVLQERIALPSEPYPGMVDGRVQYLDRMQDTDPFIYYGAYVDCCLTRLSTEDLMNVTAGGGSQVPTLLVEKR